MIGDFSQIRFTNLLLDFSELKNNDYVKLIFIKSLHYIIQPHEFVLKRSDGSFEAMAIQKCRTPALNICWPTILQP